MVPLLWLVVALLLIAIALLWRRYTYSRRSVEELIAEVASLQVEKQVFFDFLHDLGEGFTENIDRKQLLTIILTSAMKISGAKGGAIYLWNQRKTELKAETVEGLFPPPEQVPSSIASKIVSREEYLENFLRNEILRPDDTGNLLVQVATGGGAELIEYAAEDDRLPNYSEELLRTFTYMAVPLRYRELELGVMAMANTVDGMPFNEADFEIVQSVAVQAAYAIYNAQVYSQVAEKKKMDHDLKVAQEIQRILLPSKPPNVAEYQLGAVNIPARQVSGDYYDFIEVDDHRRGVVVADVSGKGLPASLIMAMCRSVLRGTAQGCYSPADVLRQVNRQLHPDIREDMFITMIYAIIDTQSHELKVARAGHEAPIMATNSFQKIEPLSCAGMALGIDSGDVFDDLIKDLTLTIQPNDTIMLYTDGITEALDENGEEFGREHLIEALRGGGNQGVDFLVDHLVEQVREFSGNQPQSDDITVAALQRRAG